MVASHHLFHAFCENPPMRFATQEADEEIVLTVRAHPITTVWWIIFTIILVLIPAFVGPALNYLPFNGAQQLFIILIWYAFTFLFAFSNMISWYFNLGIITSKKIIDVDVLNVLNTQTTETLISRIEEVNNKNLGFLSSLFNFGNVYVQTAGEDPNIEFMSVPYPSKVVRIINTLMQQQPNH